MRHSTVASLPIYFIRNCHTWLDKSTTDGYVKGQCKECGLVAMQDRGSLGYFIVDSHIASLSCEEIIIKKIIE